MAFDHFVESEIEQSLAYYIEFLANLHGQKETHIHTFCITVSLRRKELTSTRASLICIRGLFKWFFMDCNKNLQCVVWQFHRTTDIPKFAPAYSRVNQGDSWLMYFSASPKMLLLSTTKWMLLFHGVFQNVFLPNGSNTFKEKGTFQLLVVVFYRSWQFDEYSTNAVTTTARKRW